MMATDMTSKSAHKLLQQLESDPQLQSIENTTILNDEQYPVAFESSIVNLKEMIPLTSAVTILRWQDGKDGKQLTQDQLQRMRVQRQKTICNLCLNPTMDNPWDQIKFKFWKDRITNICLGASQSGQRCKHLKIPPISSIFSLLVRNRKRLCIVRISVMYRALFYSILLF